MLHLHPVPLAYLPDMPNGAVLARHEDLEPAILVGPDRQAVFFPNPSRRTPKTLPLAPKGRDIDLPGVPEGAIVTKSEGFQLLLEIERRLEPGQSNVRPRFRLLVPTLMAPSDPVRTLPPYLLPSIAEGSIARRKDLQVAVCIPLHDGFGKIAILGWFGPIEEISGFAEACPATPSAIWSRLPDVPKRVIASHCEQFLATIFVPSQRDAIRTPQSKRRLAQFRPVTPAAVRRRLPHLPGVSVTPDGKNFLPAIPIFPNGELAS